MTDFPQLPISQVLPELQQALFQHHQLLLLAPPGAGKTTLVPLALLDQSWLGLQKILLLQPRRVAARSVAQRMAELLAEPVGQTVGYRLRMDTKVSASTRIEVMTEGVFLRLLQADPSLEGVGLVIFDEFHERNLDSDLAMALSLNSRELFGDLREQPLKLMVMSATLDGVALAEFLQSACNAEVPQIVSEGRSYPVAIHYCGEYKPAEDSVARVKSVLLRAINETEGNILVFLPGVGEIRRLNQLLGDEPLPESVQIGELHGSQSLEDQRRALQPPPPGSRRVTLTTSIAQTSLTIEGVTVVVDSGLIRSPRFDPRTGLSRLQVHTVSKATATQRTGRAGRLAPGVCYRLWSEAQHQQRVDQDTPEILSADLCELILQATAWGEPNLQHLHWLDTPPTHLQNAACDLLRSLNALNTQQLTEHGQKLLAVPLHPRLGHMMVVGAELGCLALSAELAILLQAKDPLQNRSDSTDIAERISFLQTSQTNEAKRLRTEVKALLRQTQSMLSVESVQNPLEEHLAIGLLLASAYPDRIAKKTRGSDFKLANGRGVSLPTHDALAQSPWLVVANIGGRQGASRDRAFMAARLDESLFATHLKFLVEQQDRIDWDNQQGRFVGEQLDKIGQLIWRSRELQTISSEQRRQVIYQRVRDQGLAIFNCPDAVKTLQARVQLAQQSHLSSSQCQADQWPDFSEVGLLNTLEDWFMPSVDAIKTAADFKQVDVLSLLKNQLDWPQQQLLNDQLPEKIQVPSGSNIRIDYLASPPVLAVRLQEMFGLQVSPSLANGRVKLLIHLLSPAGRPLQITDDLAGFWAGSYQAVRKEMKGRYPKHHWPEDPYSVAPTRRAKSRS